MKAIIDLEAKLRGDPAHSADADVLSRLMKILYMCADEKVFWSRYDFETDTWDKANPVLLVGDAFGNGTDDGEQILMSEVDKLWDVYQRYGWDGALAWCAKKRNRTPHREFQTPKYRSARAEL